MKAAQSTVNQRFLTETLKVYDAKINSGVNNEYPTPLSSFKQPCLQMIVGQRTAGKSYLTSKILEQAKKDNTFDKIYIITPSFCSNKSYFGKHIDEADVFSPTKSSINEVISRVENVEDLRGGIALLFGCGVFRNQKQTEMEVRQRGTAQIPTHFGRLLGE